MPCLFVTRIRTLAALAVSLSFTPVAYAQAQSDPATLLERQRQESSRLAGEWLVSTDPRIRAWGAHLVLRDRHNELAPILLSMVSAYDASQNPDRDEHDAMLPVLDALIQLSIPVPDSDAAKLFSEFPAQSMILLSHSITGAERELLNIFRTAENKCGAWLAAGNLLAMRRTPGFAAALLGSITVHAIVTVTDTDDGIGFGLGTGGSCVSGGFGVKAGWPEVGDYFLSESPDLGDLVLAPGTDTAYYGRMVNASYASTRSSACDRQVPRDLARQQYLAQILDASQSDPPLRTDLRYHIAWSSEPPYISELEAIVLRQQEIFSVVAQNLQSAGLITSDEAASSRPRLRITVWDQRREPNPALPFPTIQDAQANLTFDRMP